MIHPIYCDANMKKLWKSLRKKRFVQDITFRRIAGIKRAEITMNLTDRPLSLGLDRLRRAFQACTFKRGSGHPSRLT